MKSVALSIAIGLSALALNPAEARSSFDTRSSGDGGELSPYLQCVPYAREITGIRIYGDAHTWWDQAAGRYQRGNRPQVGAVMAVQPHGNSRLGHVAAVSRVVDSRTILLRHANWSQPGKIEDNVKAVDVSPANDWSRVRIWYAPTQSLGTGEWPLYGFIYGDHSAPAARPASPVPTSPAPAPVASNDLIADIIAGRYR